VRAGVKWLAVGLGAAGLAAVAAWRGTPRPPAVALLDPEHPSVRLDREMTAEFGYAHPVVWVLAARAGTIWDPPVLAKLQALTREVLRMPGVIPTDVISLASPNLRDFQVTETGLRPVYLMAQVPADAAALAALRARVEGDPNYHGTLVSRDGRAAMVVANFRADADARAVGAAARALRDRHREAAVEVYAAGAPLASTMPAASLWSAAAAAGALAAGGLLLLAAAIGWRLSCTAALAALVSLAATFAVLMTFDLATLPWSAAAAPLVVLVSSAVAIAAPATRMRWRLCLALAAAFAVPVAWLDGPARGFALAGLIGGPLAAVIGGLAARRTPHGAPPTARWLPIAALAVLLAVGAGWTRVRVSLGLGGYGERYLVGAEATDLRAVAHHFPPPVALALRVRGAAGFVTSPEVLRALDGVVAAARRDPAVTNAMSLADIVKMVHRAFNENDPAFQVVPDDRGLVARYLALAYSPGFRRFVDRGFTRTAVWVYARADAVADLTRIRDRIAAQLAAQPIPDAAVDRYGGDGATVLAANETLHTLGTAAALGLLVMVAILAAAGVAPAARALGSALVAAGTIGTLGWLGTPVDLLALPLLLAAVPATAAVGALAASDPNGRVVRAGAALAALAAALLAVPHAAAHLLGVGLAGPALAALLKPHRVSSVAMVASPPPHH
jgi:predicted RND superfamily exporter protein